MAGQDLSAQRDTLAVAGVDPDRLFTDELSGAVGTQRPGLAALLDYARAGDTVVVAAIDRLGRSAAEVTRTIADLDIAETCCAPCGKGSTATRLGVRWRESWPLWLNLNSNWAENAAPHHARRAAIANCRLQNPKARSRKAGPT